MFVIGLVMVKGDSSSEWQRIGSNYEATTVDNDWFNTHPTYASIVDETIDGQYMVKIPKFWFKAGTVPYGTYAGNPYWMISDQPAPGFSVHPAFIGSGGTELNQIWVGKYQASASSGKLQSVPGVMPRVNMDFPTARSEAYARNTGGITGFRLWSVYDLSAIQMLASIEKGGIDMQALIGKGRVNTEQEAFVNAPDVAQATWRGIVGLWGNAWQMVDGLKTATDGQYWRWQSNTPTDYVPDDFSTGYILTGVTTINSDGWVADFDTTLLSAGLFIASKVNKSNAENPTNSYAWLFYTPDTDCVLYCGGDFTNNEKAGLFTLYLDDAPESAYRYFSTRLAKV